MFRGGLGICGFTFCQGVAQLVVFLSEPRYGLIFSAQAREIAGGLTKPLHLLVLTLELRQFFCLLAERLEFSGCSGGFGVLLSASDKKTGTAEENEDVFTHTFDLKSSGKVPRLDSSVNLPTLRNQFLKSPWR